MGGQKHLETEERKFLPFIYASNLQQSQILNFEWPGQIFTEFVVGQNGIETKKRKFLPFINASNPKFLR